MGIKTRPSSLNFKYSYLVSSVSREVVQQSLYGPEIIMEMVRQQDGNGHLVFCAHEMGTCLRSFFTDFSPIFHRRMGNLTSESKRMTNNRLASSMVLLSTILGLEGSSGSAMGSACCPR